MRTLVLLLSLLLPAFASAQTRVDVPVRDGIRLAADLYLPAGRGPFPTVLRRTPYGRANEFADGARALASLGYAVLSQDVRGAGDSEGAWNPFFLDGPDGQDTVTWIEAQPWSNGRVAGYGASAEGIAVLLALGEGADLSCGAVSVATGDLYEAFWQGGAWREELATRWLIGMEAHETFAAARTHEALDGFYDPVRLDATELSRIDVPVLFDGGFFDIFSIGTPKTFAALREAGGDAHLVMGPWTHATFGSRAQGELTFSAESTWDATADLLAFLDGCLRDGETPDFPRVRYFVTRLADDGYEAAGTWETADAWPPPSTPLVLHLFADGILRGAAPPPGAAPASLPVDPTNPIPSVGGDNLFTAAGPMDQSALDLRDDVLVLETWQAEETVRFAGEVRATIWAASDTTDVDVIVRLSQVTPSWRTLLLADGVRRGRFVGGSDAIRPLVPGEPVPFEVEIGPIAVDLPPGHALRLAIQGTSAPHVEPNPGTATPLAADPTPVPSTLTVFRDADRPSRLVLPLVAGELPGGEGGSGGSGGDGGTGGTGGHGGGGWGGGDVGPEEEVTDVCGCAAGGGASNALALAGIAALLLGRRRPVASRPGHRGNP